jgi:predicted Zn-dependent protease
MIAAFWVVLLIALLSWFFGSISNDSIPYDRTNQDSSLRDAVIDSVPQNELSTSEETKKPLDTSLARIAELIGTIKKKGDHSWLHIRRVAHHYAELADIYGALKAPKQVAYFLEPLLRSRPVSMDRQFQLVEAWVALGQRDLAQAFLEDMATFGDPVQKDLVFTRAAQWGLKPASLHSKIQRRQGHFILLSVGDVPNDIANTARAALERELGIETRLIQVPDYKLTSKYRLRLTGWQYDALSLSNELAESFKQQLSDPQFKGAIALTHVDLYEKGFNFLWALGGDHLSVISTLRFDDPDPALYAQRVAKQTLTSALDWLGAGRALLPMCVNSNAADMREFDLKSLRICSQTWLYLEQKLPLYRWTLPPK